MPETDVLYMTRIQRERFASEEEYNKVGICTQYSFVLSVNKPSHEQLLFSCKLNVLVVNFNVNFMYQNCHI